MVFLSGLKINGNKIMITHKFAFKIIKALEIFTFRHLKDNKVNDFSLIYFSISSYGSYKLTLGADWLYEMRHKTALIEIAEILKSSWRNNNAPPMFSISIEKGNIGNEHIDELISLSNSYNASEFGYYIPIRNLLLDNTYEEGYILKSKIISNFQFDKELWILVKDKKWQKCIPFSIQGDCINFLNEKGIKQLNLLSRNKLYAQSEYIETISIYDIYRVETEYNFSYVPLV